MKVVLGGAGRSGGGRGGMEDREIGCCGGGWKRGLGGRLESFILSSWSFAREVAWIRVMGLKACTSRRISGAKPEMKQLKRKEEGRPTILLARFSKSDR